MANIEMSPHAAQRFAQRGLTLTDAELILELGSEVEGGFLVRNQDLSAIERDLITYLNRIRRLRGKRLVVGGDGKIVTGYHADRRKQRALLRR